MPSILSQQTDRQIVIRLATEKDAEDVARLASSLGYAAHPDQMKRRLHAVLASESDLVIVAVDSNQTVVGWLQAHAAHIVESGFRVEITGLIVSPESRRCGAGKALVAEAERWAIAKSAETIVVRSNIQREESHLFYPALGYTPTKTQRVYRKAPVRANDPSDQVSR
jgi:predicted N-acetyltransferase YhbS